MNEAKKKLLDALVSGNKAAIEAAKRGLIQEYRNDNVLICLLNQAKKPRKRILQAKAS